MRNIEKILAVSLCQQTLILIPNDLVALAFPCMVRLYWYIALIEDWMQGNAWKH